MTGLFCKPTEVMKIQLLSQLEGSGIFDLLLEVSLIKAVPKSNHQTILPYQVFKTTSFETFRLHLWQYDRMG